jgi:hypothetical protein
MVIQGYVCQWLGVYSRLEQARRGSRKVGRTMCSPARKQLAFRWIPVKNEHEDVPRGEAPARAVGPGAGRGRRVCSLVTGVRSGPQCGRHVCLA